MSLRETRAEKYGRNFGFWLNYIFKKAGHDSRYVERVITGLGKFSFKKRKRGEPRNEGCVFELDEIETINPENPEEVARLIKEGFHLMYLKRNQRQGLSAMLDEL